LSDSEDRFDSLRRSFVEKVDAARAASSEKQLAGVLEEIATEADNDLEKVDTTGDAGHELVAAVEAWASVASYATTRFYFEGPESIFKGGGFGKSVVSSLQRHAKTYSGHLRRALAATGASSFSITVGFPFGLSVGLTWESDESRAEQKKRASELEEMEKAMKAGLAAVGRPRRRLDTEDIKKVEF